MSITIVRAVQKLDLPAAEKAVALCVASHIFHDNPEKGTWVGAQRIGAETGLAESTVRNALTSLRAKEILVQIGFLRGRQAKMPIHVVRTDHWKLHQFFSEPPANRGSEPENLSITDGEPLPNRGSEPENLSITDGEPLANSGSAGEPLANSGEPLANGPEIVLRETKERERQSRESAQPAAPSLSTQTRRHPDLKELKVKIFDRTGLALSGKNVAAANALLHEHSMEMILSAFDEFYENLDDFGKKTAIKEFFAGEAADGVIESQRQYRERQARNRVLLEEAGERARAESEAERLRQAHAEPDGVEMSL